MALIFHYVLMENVNQEGDRKHSLAWWVAFEFQAKKQGKMGHFHTHTLKCTIFSSG